MQDTPSPHSVLVADAESTIGRVFEAKLTKEGRFRVVCASNGPDACRLALQHGFDILLWDLRMRDSDILLPQLRALCPDAALLLMSTDDQPTMSVAVSRLDIAGVLVKPFGLDTLETRIRSALVHRRRKQPLHYVGFVGQSVCLRSRAGSCETRIFENSQDTFLVVGSPRVATPSDFAVGRPVEVEYNGCGALYTFDSVLVREVAVPLPCWELAMPTVIRRSQRRSALRFPLQRPIRLHTGIEGSEVFCEGTTVDVSCAGLAMETTVALEAETRLHFTLSPDIAGQAVVVWSRSQPAADGAPCHRIALRFDVMPAPTQKHLSRWLEKSDPLW